MHQEMVSIANVGDVRSAEDRYISERIPSEARESPQSNGPVTVSCKSKVTVAAIGNNGRLYIFGAHGARSLRLYPDDLHLGSAPATMQVARLSLRRNGLFYFIFRGVNGINNVRQRHR